MRTRIRTTAIFLIISLFTAVLHTVLWLANKEHTPAIPHSGAAVKRYSVSTQCDIHVGTQVCYFPLVDFLYAPLLSRATRQGLHVSAQTNLAEHEYIPQTEELCLPIK